MPDWASEMLRYGPLGAFALAVCWGGWRSIVYIGHKLFDDDKGIVPVWVADERRWRVGLTERLEQQSVVCGQHKTVLEEQKIVSLATEKHLARLVDLHEKPGEAIKQATVHIATTTKDVESLKAAALRACEMCRSVAKIECPDSATVVNQHCDEIERIIGEA